MPLKSLLSAALFSATALAVPASATTLGDVAAGLAEGQWAELKNSGWTSALIVTGTDNILNYSNSAVWDPAKKELRFVGQGHNEAEKMIVYSDATNSWKNATPPGSGGLGHGYDHNAIDPKTGVEYYRKFGSNQIFSLEGGVWKGDERLPEDGDDLACCGSLTYFPEMGALTFWGGGALYTRTNGKWAKTGGRLTVGDYHNVAEYSAPYKTVFGGGGNGSKQLYALSATGQMAYVPPAPVGIGIYSSLLVADPVSGELVLIGRDKTLWSYYPGKDIWARLPEPNVRLFEDGDNPIAFTIAAGISTYNVIMVVKKNSVLVYKHKAQGPISIMPSNRAKMLRNQNGKLVLSVGGAPDLPWDKALGYRDTAGRKRSLQVGEGTPAGYLLPPTPAAE